MHFRFWILGLALPLALSGCETMDTMTSWFDDEESTAIVEEPAARASEKFVTVTVLDGRYGFRIKDPMGQRTTGGNCGIWKDQKKERKGTCCWNTRGECGCPCPERIEDSLPEIEAEAPPAT